MAMCAKIAPNGISITETKESNIACTSRCSAPAGIDSCGKSVTLIDNFKAVEKEIW